MPDREVIEQRRSGAGAKRLFVNKNPWQRIAVVVAGPAANVIFTFLVLYALLLGYGRYTIPPLIGSVTPGSVAEAAGCIENDRSVSVDGYEVRGFEDFQRLVATAPQRPVTIVVDRPDGPQTIVVVPEVAVEHRPLRQRAPDRPHRRHPQRRPRTR